MFSHLLDVFEKFSCEIAIDFLYFVQFLAFFRRFVLAVKSFLDWPFNMKLVDTVAQI